MIDYAKRHDLLPEGKRIESLRMATARLVPLQRKADQEEQVRKAAKEAKKTEKAKAKGKRKRKRKAKKVTKKG